MKKLSLFLIAVSLLVVSCKKENIGTPVPEPGTLAKTLASTTLFGKQSSFEYNSNGSFKQIINEQIWVTSKFVFVYDPGKITMTTYNMANNQKQEQYIFFLNARGYADKIVRTGFDNLGNPINSNTVDFFYNVKGQLEKRVGDAGFEIKYFYDAEGNRNKSEYYNNTNQLLYITYYEYTSLEDKQPFASPIADLWTSWCLPPHSKKLFSKIKEIDVLQNKVIYEESLSYELDAEGYVVKGIVDELPGSTDWVWTNTWMK